MARGQGKRMAAMMRRFWQQEAEANGVGMQSAVAGRPQVRYISSATLRMLQGSNGARSYSELIVAAQICWLRSRSSSVCCANTCSLRRVCVADHADTCSQAVEFIHIAGSSVVRNLMKLIPGVSKQRAGEVDVGECWTCARLVQHYQVAMLIAIIKLHTRAHVSFMLYFGRELHPVTIPIGLLVQEQAAVVSTRLLQQSASIRSRVNAQSLPAAWTD